MYKKSISDVYAKYYSVLYFSARIEKKRLFVSEFLIRSFIGVKFSLLIFVNYYFTATKMIRNLFLF